MDSAKPNRTPTGCRLDTYIAHIEQGSTGYESNMNRMITGYESDKMIIDEDIVRTNRTILALTKLVGTSIIF
jgi:hypothetical protein